MRNVWFMDVSHMVRTYEESTMSGRTWCGQRFTEWARGSPLPGNPQAWMAGFCDEVVTCLWCAAR